MTATRTLYKSDMRPEFEPFTIQPPEVKGFQYEGDLAYELRSRHLDSQAAIDLLDDMLAIREVEEMIVRLRSGGYEPLQGFDVIEKRAHEPAPAFGIDVVVDVLLAHALSRDGGQNECMTF